MTKRHSDMTSVQVRHYQEYFKQYNQKNKSIISKSRQSKHIRRKLKIFHKYLQLGYGSGLSCQIPGCKECAIKKLGFFSTYDNSEADLYRSIEGAETRYRHLIKRGYPDIGAVSICMKCYYIIRREICKENKLANKIKRPKSVKVALRSKLRGRLRKIFKRFPDKNLSEEGKKDKRKLERWIKESEEVENSGKRGIRRNKIEKVDEKEGKDVGTSNSC